MPSELVPKVFFSCAGYCFDVFAVSGDYAACFHDPFCVVSVVMLWSPLPTTVLWVHSPSSSC